MKPFMYVFVVQAKPVSSFVSTYLQVMSSAVQELQHDVIAV